MLIWQTTERPGRQGPSDEHPGNRVKIWKVRHTQKRRRKEALGWGRQGPRSRSSFSCCPFFHWVWQDSECVDSANKEAKQLSTTLHCQTCHTGTWKTTFGLILGQQDDEFKSKGLSWRLCQIKILFPRDLFLENKIGNIKYLICHLHDGTAGYNITFNTRL